MTGQNYLDTYQGQSLLYAPSPAREVLRGQCVQSVCFYAVANGGRVLWVEGACQWWDAAANCPEYERIPNTPSAVPQAGDIIIWSSALPGSGGYGHIAVCLRPLPGTGTFISVDQNWGGKTVHAVTHNYNYVVGWLRIKGAAQPAPAPAPAPAAQTQGVDEMIVNADQASKLYRLLRPNGGVSQDEINATVNRRTFAGFVNDAQGEVNARDAALRDQNTHMSEMQNVINSQNQTITDLNQKLSSSELSGQEKQQALNEALGKMADQNAQITTLHDKVTQLQPVVEQPTTKPIEPGKPNWLTKILIAVFDYKTKKSGQK
jgi:hypothetical protein